MKKNIALIVSCVLTCIMLILVCLTGLFYNYYKPENIFKRNISKVVEIKVSSDNEIWGYATGCFIDNNGTILTNKHVVYNQSSGTNFEHVLVRIATAEDFIPATIEKVSEDYDLAIIKIEAKTDNYFDIHDGIFDGEEIFTIGNPNGFGLSFTRGLVSSNSRNVIYNEQTINAIQTNFVINEGNSGGPVFNKNGELIGLISFRLKDNKGDIISGVSFAVPAKNILDFI